MKIKIGLDEAGRGCVLGPLYVGAAVFWSEEDEDYFRKIGVKDSKQLTAEKRDSLFLEIKKHCYSTYETISVEEIDNGNLNDLEFNVMVSLAKKVMCQCTAAYFIEREFTLYIDCPDQDTESHAKRIKNALPHSCSVDVISEHKADDKFVVVGASSIVAKVLRDREIDRIKNLYLSEYGDFGSGYPSDVRTRNFLEKYYEINKKFPIETRMKWGTIEKIRKGANSENSKSSWEGVWDYTKNGQRNSQSY